MIIARPCVSVCAMRLNYIGNKNKSMTMVPNALRIPLHMIVRRPQTHIDTYTQEVHRTQPVCVYEA